LINFRQHLVQPIIDAHFAKVQVPNALNQLNKWEEERLTKLIHILEAEEKAQQQLEPAINTAANLPAEIVVRPKSPVQIDTKLPLDLKAAVQNALQRTDIDLDQISLYLNSVSQLHNNADNYNRNMEQKIRRYNELLSSGAGDDADDDDNTRELLGNIVSS